MSKKFEIKPEDMATFQKAMEGTKPLIHKKIRLSPPLPKTKKPQPPVEEHFHFMEISDLETVNSEDFISYKHSSISHKILRKLRKGQYNVDAMLDLHGMTIEKASIALEEFLKECLEDQLRVVLIIHGKNRQNTPILKNKLNHWLRTIDMVLAFCSAGPTHGSRGAIYVLLKRAIEEKFV